VKFHNFIINLHVFASFFRKNSEVKCNAFEWFLSKNLHKYKAHFIKIHLLIIIWILIEHQKNLIIYIYSHFIFIAVSSTNSQK